MKILTVVGARPQFIKAAAVSSCLRARHREVLVHTGQHYDETMSDVFFRDLHMPAPDYELGVGSGSQADQTARMLTAIGGVVEQELPDVMLLYGDTNSTLAGALAASKLQVPIAHVEAGLRSFNRNMSEEINRIVTDRLAHHLFCPSQTAVNNLAREGITRGVHVVGDVMIATLRQFMAAPGDSVVLERHRLTAGEYVLTTIHRAENTDDPSRLLSIVAALDQLQETIIFPAHPRVLKALADIGWQPRSDIRIVEPVGYVEMIELERHARLVMTDSGGVQKEAYWLGVPCVTLREETEWVETVENGWNRLAGVTADGIIHTVRTMRPPAIRPPLYGDDSPDRLSAVRLIVDALGALA